MVAYAANVADQEEMGIEIDPNGRGGFYLKDSSGPFEDILGTSVNDGLWHHVVGVKQGSAAFVYIDGKLSGSSTQVLDSDFDFSGSGIGLNNISSVYPYTGLVDEMAVWRRALSVAEVEGLYLRGRLNVRFQISVCAQNDCSDASFLGPDGTGATYFSESSKHLYNAPTLNMPAQLTGRYFQYRTILDAEVSTKTPKIKSVQVDFD